MRSPARSSKVGADVNTTYGSGWKAGDRVQVIAAVPCGDCCECRKGWMAVCQNQTSMGYQCDDGGFAEYMIAPTGSQSRWLNRIPDNVRVRRGVGGRTVRVRHQRQELLGIEEGDTVVVFRRRPDRLHAHPDRARRAQARPGLSSTSTPNGCRCRPTRCPRRIIDGIPGRCGGAGHGAHRRPRRRRRDHRDGRQCCSGAGDFDGRAKWPHLVLRRPAQTDPTITCDSNLVHYRQLHIHGANGSAPEHNKRALRYISTGQVPVKGSDPRIPLTDVMTPSRSSSSG